jgi:hypothetical protein
MHKTLFAVALILLIALICSWGRAPVASAPREVPGKATLLENLSWDEAEHILTPDAVVVIALGAESKEHGRHLQLNNDFLEAEYFKRRVLAAAPGNVVVARPRSASIRLAR